MKPIRDLNGQKFGRLLVLNCGSKTKSGGYKWNVRCDCGTEKEIPSDHLVRKTGPVTSCGCALVESNQNAFDPDKTAFNLLLGSYRKRAKLKQREFSLSVDEFKSLTKKNCGYCGQQPKTVSYNRPKTGRYIHNGIDRIDPALGYIFDNCEPCCKLCNYMKLALSKEDFLSHISAISKFQQGKNHA